MRDRADNVTRRAKLDRRIAGILTAFEDGNYQRSLTERLTTLETERHALDTELRDTPPDPVVHLHPRIAELYAEKVAHLEAALADPAIRVEAAELLRSMIDRIELYPEPKGKRLTAHLHGDLAAILAACDDARANDKLLGGKAPGSQLSVVAGARNRRYLHLDFARL